MSDSNAPIHIPSELNVPDQEPTSENDTIEPIQPKSALKSQSADEKQFPKHRLRMDAKSRSMYDFPVSERKNDAPDTEPEQEQEPNSSSHNEEIERHEIVAPTITFSPPSATFRRSASRNSTSSLEHVKSSANHLDVHHIGGSTNDMKLSANRNRINSIASERDDDEFDELEPTQRVNSQLRIRSSIVSMFGRMGKMRRASTVSQASTNENGAATETNNRGPPLRALPQIAATKIFRAFSYVGKLHGINIWY